MSRQVEPRFKTAKERKSKRRGLRRVGEKTRRDIDELHEAKVVLLFRSQGRCEGRRHSDLCTGYGTQVHHVVRRSQGGSNDPENLVWLCAMCHAHVHAFPAEALIAGLLKPGGAA